MPTFELNLSDDVYAEFQQLATASSSPRSRPQRSSSPRASRRTTSPSSTRSRTHDEMLTGAENNMFDTAQDPGSIEDDRL